MTKKQNRTHGFGKRSLSLLLAMLLVLSTMAVMLTTTMLTAHAGYGGSDIWRWYVAGPFNDWNAEDSNYKLDWNSSSNQFEGRIPPVVASQPFKLVAKKDNGSVSWTGIASSSDNKIALGAFPALDWNSSAQNIYLKDGSGGSVNNPEYLNFYVKNDGGFHFSVTATAWNTAGDNHGGFEYNAPASVSPGNTDGNGIFWAKATYFDYLSDWEKSNTSWLKPVKAGTGFKWSNDEWYPFYNFNRDVIKPYASSGWNPLYFGNFCYTDGAYDVSGHHYGTTNGFDDATNSYNVSNFKYAINNSNATNNGSVGGQGIQDLHQSYQGLMNNHLSSTGDLLISGSNTKAPYFDKSALGYYANVVNSAFPFRVTDNGAYKTYQFNSTGGTDNVYFTWAKDGNSTKPTSVNYGSGTSFGVKDGIEHFMKDESSGYGIFPFNNASSTNKGNKNNSNENLDYGFGIKMEVQFRVPAPSSTVNTSSNPIKFDFSGDDDLWMYITDNSTGDSYLVLDMGGNHKMSSGSVNFNNLTTKVDHVYNAGTYPNDSVTTSFSELGLNFDYNKTYTMTVFYMERGLIESNCEMTFSMYPAGNQVNVEKEVDVAAINSSELQADVEAVDSFDFTAYQADSASGSNSAMKNTEYLHNTGGNKKTDASTGAFQLKDAENASFLSQYTTNKYVQVTETVPSNSKLKYSTTWEVKDPLDSNRNKSGSGTSAAKLQLKNPSGESYDYAQLDYKFINKPDTGSVSVTKTVENPSSEDLTKEFSGKVTVSLDGGSTYKAYPLTYTVSDKPTSTYTLNSSGTLVTDAKLKHGRTLRFNNLPTNAVVKVEEYLGSDADLYTLSYPSGQKTTVPANGGNHTISVVNTPITPGEITGSVSGTKKFDGTDYTGEMFSFKLKGVPRFAGDASNIIDTSGMAELETTTVTNGAFSIDGIVFDAPGVYRYYMYEDMDRLAELDTLHGGLTHYADDISNAHPAYLVSFTITKVGSELVKSDPVYYPYDGEYADITSADFDSTKAQNSVTFNNTSEQAYVEIEKTNQTGEPVEGVIFAVIAISDDIANQMAGMTDIEAYDFIKQKIADHDTGVSVKGSDFTDDEGYVKLDGLPIYQDGYKTSSAPEYQKYCLIEYTGPATYSINKTVYPEGTHYFSFPMEDTQTHEWQYHCTFEYVNGKLRMPSTSGVGMTIFKIFGFGFLGFAVIAFGGYMLYSRKRKTVKAKHFSK